MFLGKYIPADEVEEKTFASWKRPLNTYRNGTGDLINEYNTKSKNPEVSDFKVHQRRRKKQAQFREMGISDYNLFKVRLL